MFSNLLASDATTQRSQNSRTEKMEQALQCSKVEKDDKSASILRKTPKMVIERRVAKHQQKSNVQNGTDLLKSDQLSKGISQDNEVSCEVSDADTTDIKGNLSAATPEISPSIISTVISGKTTVNEINEIMEEIFSRIQCITLTRERLDRIKNYFAKSKMFTLCESDAFEWITDNMQTIYKNPINACKKLRIAIGSRSISIDLATKVFHF
ncbi:Uncharacterized protein BM_BM14164 [Brugia malayi]|uniref:Uncharacterized protein n=1 Tax=Brugia malayi TaxID=6279 RepID=A0A4E9FTJ3_BRUMA|nr:Uncharacterized protein BM_BM14164 [Brugia malayi]VIO97760.1 Uncharacterized protein BM_BM14164 [Brugia malayi]